MPWSDALARLLLASATAADGNLRGAAAVLTQAVTALDSVGMDLFAAAARRRLGRLLGGDQGHALVDAADHWMLGQQIVDPERMTAAFAPGFPD